MYLKMMKSKAQEIFKESLKKLNQMIFNLDRNLGLVSNIGTLHEESQINIVTCSNINTQPIPQDNLNLPKKKLINQKEKPKEDTLLTLFNECDIRVGRVTELKNKENSEDIYLLKVDLGEKNLRNIGTGLRKYLPPEEIEGKQVLVFSNLKPKKLGDFVSEGMVLCCYDESETKFELPRPNESIIFDLKKY
jgi:methionine--tRNA ligase beta chain